VTIHLNLSSVDQLALLHALQSALSRSKKNLRIELLGPGSLLADTALVLFEVLRNRPADLQVHIHTWTCLSEGAVLLWLGGDTRSMRSDTWIEIPPLPESDGERFEICRSVPACEESPAETDMRTLLAHVDQWLPVGEVAGLRLFQHELREFGLLDDEQQNEKLAGYFKIPETA
jgi:hypothetical protein